MKLAIMAFSVLLLSGCAFLVDRGPEDLGRFADCRKVGCL